MMEYEFALWPTDTIDSIGSKEIDAMPLAVIPCTDPSPSVVVTRDTPVAKFPQALRNLSAFITLSQKKLIKMSLKDKAPISCLCRI